VFIARYGLNALIIEVKLGLEQGKRNHSAVLRKVTSSYALLLHAPESYTWPVLYQVAIRSQ